MMASGAEESLNPKRDVPLAFGISVGGCIVLYVLMAMVITGKTALLDRPGPCLYHLQQLLGSFVVDSKQQLSP